MSSRKSKWEFAALIGIIVLMAGGLLWTVIALVTAPKIEDPFADAEGEPPERMVRENPRVYLQNMNVHVMTSKKTAIDEFDERDDKKHDKLIPVIPEGMDSVSAPVHFDPAMDALITRNRARGNNRNQEDDLLSDDEDEEDNSTGWGWLADDIAKKRNAKEEAAAEREEDTAEQDRLLGKEDEKDDRTDEGRDDPVYFTDSLFNSGGDTSDSYTPNIYRDDQYQEVDEEDASRAQAVADDVETEAAADNGSSWGDTRDVLAVRDPFASANDDVDRSSSRNWGMSNEDENFSGIDYGRDNFGGTAGYDVDASSSYGVGREVGRIVEAAEFRGDTQAGYASDSMFRSGGGYTPSGVNAYQSDSRFTDSGVFGGNSAAALTPINSGGSLSQPQSSTYTPSSSSSLRTGGDSELSTPNTLPW